MIDFFIEISPDKNSFKLSRSLFDKRPVYKQFPAFLKEIQTDHAKVLALSSETEDRAIYESEKLLVIIYGYCFTRLDSALPNKKRLDATELAELFDSFGQQITDMIKGSYTIAIYQKLNNILDVFSDELNLRNVYYAHSGKNFLVASSLALFPVYSPADFNQPNHKSILEYYLFDFTLVNETFLDNVNTIPSGCHLKFENNRLTNRQFWNIFEKFGQIKPVLGTEEAFHACDTLLKANLELYLSHPDKTAVALTGGYDSRTNLALLGKNAKKYTYYSYGFPGSYDIDLSKKIASKAGLIYHPIELNKEYEQSFNLNAQTAILLGDGISEMTRANYVFAYRDFDKKYKYILTGLFGSELIKRPTSLGGYIDKNVKLLLSGKNILADYEQIIQSALQNDCIKKEIIVEYKDAIYHDLKNNPFLCNDYEASLKFFFFITGEGILNYFRKEIKVERPWVENLHPFLDIEFIELLLKTPFPWIYNWDQKKSLLGNLQIHKFYAWLITKNNPLLGNIISTHAYKPRFLLKKIYLPFLVIQYAYFRNKILKKSTFRNDELIIKFYKDIAKTAYQDHGIFNNSGMDGLYNNNRKDFTRMISLQWWLQNITV